MPLELPSKDPNILPPGEYKTDIFNQTPLFYVKSKYDLKKNYISLVSSWEEAYALHGFSSINDINPAYLASLITFSNTSLYSPYKNIFRVPRSKKVFLTQNNSMKIQGYDQFGKKYKYKYIEDLYTMVQDRLIYIIKKFVNGENNIVACEHSSGLDSNAILGNLVNFCGLTKSRIHTFSNENYGEKILIKKYREFFKLHKSNCHKLVVDKSKENNYLLIKKYGFPPLVGRNIELINEVTKYRCNKILSGFGGDQGISNYGLNTPIDLIKDLRILDLIKWSNSFKDFSKVLLSRSFGHFVPFLKQITFNKNTYCLNNENNLLIKFLSAKYRIKLKPFLNTVSYPWHLDLYVRQNYSIKQRVLSDLVAVRVEEEKRLANLFGIEKSFPFLDIKLIELLLKVDPIQMADKSSNGRLVLRNAAKDYLPDWAEFKKSRPINSDQNIELSKRIRFKIQESIAGFANYHKNTRVIWEINKLSEFIKRELENEEINENNLYHLLNATIVLDLINSWFELLDS